MQNIFERFFFHEKMFFFTVQCNSGDMTTTSHYFADSTDYPAFKLSIQLLLHELVKTMTLGDFVHTDFVNFEFEINWH